jgi:hypothetical protein
MALPDKATAEYAGLEPQPIVRCKEYQPRDGPRKEKDEGIVLATDSFRDPRPLAPTWYGTQLDICAWATGIDVPSCRSPAEHGWKAWKMARGGIYSRSWFSRPRAAMRPATERDGSPASPFFLFGEEILMRYTVLMLALVLTCSLLLADDKSQKPITPAEAAKMVDQQCTVEMKVQSTGKSRTLVFLNSEENYRDDKNFTVVIFEKGLEGLKKQKIDDPATHYKGKTVRVTGTVTLYNQKPQIKVEDAEQIQVVDTKEK